MKKAKEIAQFIDYTLNNRNYKDYDEMRKNKRRRSSFSLTKKLQSIRFSKELSSNLKKFKNKILEVHFSPGFSFPGLAD